jgi:predicted Zn-dependent protease
LGVSKPLLLLAMCAVLAGCQDAGVVQRLERSLETGVTPAGAEISAPIVTDAPASEETPSEPLDLSPETQAQLGKELAGAALEQALRSPDREMEAYLTSMVANLARSLPVETPTYPWRVYLIESATPNAFTAGGGHIFVTTALVKRLDTEAQMAMVLAHELAHNIEGDVVKGYNGRDVSQRVAAFGRRIFDEQIGVPWVSQGIASIANTSLSNFTRAQEERADRIGLGIMAAAGYDPREAPRSFDALIRKPEVKSPFDIFKGYPPGLKRVETVRDEVAFRWRGRDLSRAIVSTPEYDALWATLDTAVEN